MNLDEILTSALSPIDERQVLLSYYNKQLDAVLEAQKMLKSREDELRAKIKEHTLPVKKFSSRIYYGGGSEIGDTYPLSGSWADKISYVLKAQARPMLASEIVDELIKIQPELSDKNIKSSIYPTLSDNQKRFKKELDESRGVNVFSLNQVIAMT